MIKKILLCLERKFVSLLSHINVLVASKYLFKRSQKKKLNLDNPTTFNEKLMWLKLNNYNSNELVWKCSDKYMVREYAISKGVSIDNLPKLINVYNEVDEIDFNKLPNKFALKCTHGCGFNIICDNKDNLNKSDAIKKLKKWQETKFGFETAETHYTHIKPKIICEEYIDSDNGKLPYDYKFYCFNGKAKCVLVCSNREKNLCLNYYNIKWNELDYGNKKLRSLEKIDCPKHLKKMINIAEIVSKDFPFVRVDFYEYHGKAILGELTFTPAACIASYYSEKGQKELGRMLNLNK